VEEVAVLEVMTEVATRARDAGGGRLLVGLLDPDMCARAARGHFKDVLNSQPEQSRRETDQGQRATGEELGCKWEVFLNEKGHAALVVKWTSMGADAEGLGAVLAVLIPIPLSKLPQRRFQALRSCSRLPAACLHTPIHFFSRIKVGQ